MITIRQSLKGTNISQGGYGCGIIFIFICVRGILSLLYKYYTSKHDVFLVLCLFFGIFLGIALFIFRSESKIRRAKNLKNNGNGILKRLPVSAIGYYDKERTGFSGYYLEIKDGDMTYRSDGFETAEKEGLSKEEYQAIYNEYGFDYDEKYKQNVLDKIDEDLSSTEHKAENSRFLKKWFIKNTTYDYLKDCRIIVEQGYKPEKMIVNGKTISVGDLVDIYVDPNDNSIYHVDID